VLFDLRSPGRRRVIKVIYGFLAVLMGGGLIFFGIGSDATGGLADIFGGGSGGSADTGFEDQIDDAEARVEQNPRDQRALLDLVTLNFQAGSQQVEVDPDTGATVLTEDAEDSYNRAADAWDAYLDLKPKRPDTAAATQMVQAFFVLAQNASSPADARAEVESAAEAQQIATDANPSTGNLRNLAFYLYFAGDFAAADRAAQQAVAKAPAGQRNAVESQLEQAERGGRAFQEQIKAERKGAGGENPLEEPGGGLGGGGALGGP
jgi:hypothetical protein